MSLSVGAPLGDLGGWSPSTGKFEDSLKEGSGYGASLSRGTWRGAPLLGTL